MLKRLSTEYLARASASNPKRTIAIWLVMLIAAFVAIATFIDGTMTTEFFFFNNPDSKRASSLLEDRLRGPADVNEVIIVRSSTVTVDDAAYEEFVTGLRDKVAGLGSSLVASVASYYETGDESMVSADRRTTVVPIVMAGGFKEAESNVESVLEVIDDTEVGDQFEVFITGQSTFSRDFVEGNQADAEKGEAFGVPIALVILAVLFGALAAAVLPVMLAITSILVAFGLVLLIGQAIQVQAFAQNLITMIGLAVGIDYSLFIVSRFREELARGREKLDAIAVAGGTASRAVLFSGMTVVLAVLGVLIVPDRVFFSVGLGMITVVTVAVIASMTLLPAVLSLMGDRVNRFRIPFIGTRRTQSADAQGGVWGRIAYAVMRRPIISLVVTVGLLVAAIVPYFDINTGTSGVSELPDHFRAKQGFEVLREEFGFGLNAPAEVVIDGDIDSAAVQGAIEKLAASLQSDPGLRPFHDYSEPVRRPGAAVGAAGSGTVDRRGYRLRATITRRIYPPGLLGRFGWRVRYRNYREGDRLHRHGTAIPADRTGSGARFELHTANNGLPIDRDSRHGDHNEPSFGGSGIRDPGLGLAEGGGQRDLRLPASGSSPGVAADHDVRHPIRAVDGLPGIPDQPNPGALSADGRQRRGRGSWSAVYRRAHHRGGTDHGGDILRLRRRRPDPHGPVRVRHGRGDSD